jgi:superfamily II DNA or RNA helicase
MTAVAVAPPQPISLRDYQADVIAKARTEMRAGRTRCVIVIPTGGGKTRIGGAIVQSAIAKGGRVLWLAHRSELVEQAALTLESFGLTVGVVAASSRRRPSPDAPVQVASIQTLVARTEGRPPATLLVWDEAHHCSEAAELWAGLLEAYAGVPMIGLTATPERGDGAGLAPLFTGLVVGATVRELTEAGHLVPCEIVRPGRMLEPGQIAQDPITAYREHGGGRQGILFARSVEEAQQYATRLTAEGVRAECVTATTSPADRDAALELFRRGVVRILTNVFVLTEGTDLPMASVCILARGAGSAGIFVQMVGRVLRPSPGKTSALLLDLRGVTHGHVGLPEDERLYSLEGRGMRLAQTMRCRVCQGPLPGGYPCECGYAPTSAESAETVIAGVPLEKFSRMIAQGPQQRQETLERWVRRALAAGHNPRSVRYKWKAVYGEELSADRLMAAVTAVARV